MSVEDGFVTAQDCRWIMTKDELKRFKMWIIDKPGKRDLQGRMMWPYEEVAKFFNAIQKELPEKQL